MNTFNNGGNKKRNNSKKAQVERYDGTNERANRVISPGEVWWIVNGAEGRRPIQADTAEKALEKYKKRTV